jgi:hypothetical protein
MFIYRVKRRWVGDDVQASGGKIVKMGSAELTRLWNLNADNMDACKDDKRVFLPNLEDFSFVMYKKKITIFWFFLVKVI